MPDFPLIVAIYVIWWWLSLFAALPIGAHSPHELGAPTEKGNNPGAPVAPGLGKKMLWASLAAVLLSIVTVIVIMIDPFNLRPDVPR